LAATALDSLRVALPRQVGADLLREMLLVTGRDGQTGQTHRESGVGKRVETSGGGDDRFEDGWGVAVTVKTQTGAEGKKSRRHSGLWQTGS
jgi:hypothetical protein